MTSLELKPAFTSDGTLVLAILCGLFFSVISYFIFSGNGNKPLIGLIVSAIIFTVTVLGVGIFRGRQIFKTKRILLENNIISVFLQGNKKDVIDLSQIQKADLVENTIVYPDGGFYIQWLLNFINVRNQSYTLFLDGYRKTAIENLVSYLTSNQKPIVVSRIKLLNGK